MEPTKVNALSQLEEKLDNQRRNQSTANLLVTQSSKAAGKKMVSRGSSIVASIQPVQMTKGVSDTPAASSAIPAGSSSQQNPPSLTCQPPLKRYRTSQANESESCVHKKHKGRTTEEEEEEEKDVIITKLNNAAEVLRDLVDCFEGGHLEEMNDQQVQFLNNCAFLAAKVKFPSLYFTCIFNSSPSSHFISIFIFTQNS